MRHYLTKQAMKAVKASVVMLTFFGLAGTAMADKKITLKPLQLLERTCL